MGELVQEAVACRAKDEGVDGGNRKIVDSSGYFQPWPRSDLYFVIMQDDSTVNLKVCAASLLTLCCDCRPARPAFVLYSQLESRF